MCIFLSGACWISLEFVAVLPPPPPPERGRKGEGGGGGGGKTVTVCPKTPIFFGAFGADLTNIDRFSNLFGVLRAPQAKILTHLPSKINFLKGFYVWKLFHSNNLLTIVFGTLGTFPTGPPTPPGTLPKYRPGNTPKSPEPSSKKW